MTKTNAAVRPGLTGVSDGVRKLAEATASAKKTWQDMRGQIPGADTSQGDQLDQLIAGGEQLLDSGPTLVSGSASLKRGGEQLRDGAGSLADGSHQLADGLGRLASGTHAVAEGTGALVQRRTDSARESRTRPAAEPTWPGASSSTRWGSRSTPTGSARRATAPSS
ncbi:hypothetical protein [Propioniciclava flava]